MEINNKYISENHHKTDRLVLSSITLSSLFVVFPFSFLSVSILFSYKVMISIEYRYSDHSVIFSHKENMVVDMRRTNFLFRTDDDFSSLHSNISNRGTCACLTFPFSFAVCWVFHENVYIFTFFHVQILVCHVFN